MLWERKWEGKRHMLEGEFEHSWEDTKEEEENIKIGDDHIDGSIKYDCLLLVTSNMPCFRFL